MERRRGTFQYLRFLRSNSGVSMVSILVGLALLGVLFQGLINTMTFMGKAQKGVGEKAAISEAKRSISLVLRNQQACSCIFTTNNTIAGAATTAPYTFDTTNLPGGLSDGGGLNPAPITVSSWNQDCTIPGQLVATSVGAPSLLPNENNIQVLSMDVQNLQALGSTYMADIVTQFQIVDSTITSGAPLIQERIPVVFGVSIAGTTATITGCLENTQGSETAIAMDILPPNIARIYPVNSSNVALIGQTISLRFNDGIYRSITISLFPPPGNHTYRFPTHSTDTGGLGGAGWHYLYAVPLVPPVFGAPVGGDATQFGFIASANPPWDGLGGAFAGMPFRYLGPIFFSTVGGNIRQDVHHGEMITFANPMIPGGFPQPIPIPWPNPAVPPTPPMQAGTGPADFVIDVPQTASAAIVNLVIQSVNVGVTNPGLPITSYSQGVGRRGALVPMFTHQYNHVWGGPSSETWGSRMDGLIVPLQAQSVDDQKMINYRSSGNWNNPDIAEQVEIMGFIDKNRNQP